MDLDGTTATLGGGELDFDDLILPVVDSRAPTDTVLSLGTNGLLVFPINGELAGINALLASGLPLHIAPRWPNHLDPILLLTADEKRCGDVAGIEEVLTWSKVCLLQLRTFSACKKLNQIRRGWQISRPVLGPKTGASVYNSSN